MISLIGHFSFDLHVMRNMVIGVFGLIALVCAAAGPPLLVINPQGSGWNRVGWAMMRTLTALTAFVGLGLASYILITGWNRVGFHTYIEGGRPTLALALVVTSLVLDAMILIGAPRKYKKGEAHWFVRFLQ